MNTTTFDIQRVGWLIYRHLILNMKTFLIIAGIGAGLIIISGIAEVVIKGMIQSYQFEAANISTPNIMSRGLTYMMIAGFILSASIFNELHTETKCYGYLTLPASTTEKLVSGWLLSSILFVVVWMAIILVSMVVVNITTLIIGASPDWFSGIKLAAVSKTIMNYLILQTIFLFGATLFRGYNFIKTVLSLIGFSFVLMIVTMIIARITLGTFSFSDENMPGEFIDFMKYTFAPTIRFIYLYIMGPFFLVITWLKLKEREVKDGVQG